MVAGPEDKAKREVQLHDEDTAEADEPQVRPPQATRICVWKTVFKPAWYLRVSCGQPAGLTTKGLFQLRTSRDG